MMTIQQIKQYVKEAFPDITPEQKRLIEALNKALKAHGSKYRVSDSDQIWKSLYAFSDEILRRKRK